MHPEGPQSPPPSNHHADQLGANPPARAESNHDNNANPTPPDRTSERPSSPTRAAIAGLATHRQPVIVHPPSGQPDNTKTSNAEQQLQPAIPPDSHSPEPEVADALSAWLRDARRAARTTTRTIPGTIEIDRSDEQDTDTPEPPSSSLSADADHPTHDGTNNPNTVRTNADQSPAITSTLRTPAQRRKRRWIIVGVSTTAAALIAGVAFLFIHALSRERPAWWRTVDGNDPRTREAATAVQNGLATHLTKARTTTDNTNTNSAATSQPQDQHTTDQPLDSTNDTGQPWALSLRSSDANAWLNTMLPGWLENQSADFVWPDELVEVQVEFDRGRVIVGALIKQPGGSRVYSASVIPVVLDDGSLWMPAERVGVGRVPIPAAWVLRADKNDTAGAAVGPAPALVPASVRDREETIGMFRAFAGAGPMLADASVDLGDGRRVRLLGLKADQGVLTITCQTEYTPKQPTTSRRSIAADPAEDRDM